MEKNSAPLGRRGECARLRRTGDTAPTFLSSCRKKSRRRSGGKERRFRAKPAPMAPFCAKRLVAVASAVQTCKPVPGAPHAGETEIARRRMPNCRLAFGVVNEWNCFSFRSPSGGVVQNRGPAGPLVWSFQGGPGGNRNPPGFHLGPEERASVDRAVDARPLWGAWGDTSFFKREMSPLLPSPLCQRGNKNSPSGWTGCQCVLPISR